LVCKNALSKILILSKDEVYIDQSGNVYIDQSGNVYIDQSGNVYIDQSGNTKLVFKVIFDQDIYRPEHLSSKHVKTFIVFIMNT
jgi:hypothetical protein